MKIEDLRELIQDDLLTYLAGMPDRILTEVCEIVVKRCNEFRDKNKD